MKYPTLKAEKKKTLCIGPLNKGLDLSDSPLYIDDGSLSDCKNVIYSDGALKTRPGISAESENILEGSYTNDAFFNNYQITDSELYINGDYYRIVTEISEMGLSEYNVSVYLLGRDREITSIGKMNFVRVTDEEFYIPSNITFYQGRPKAGAGIYALVTENNMEDYTQTLYEIYELNTNKSAWKKSTNFYVPTVYINGRGDSYELAKADNFAFTGVPKVLEAPNMLNGKFYAYFSSDGYSTSFTLPINKLADVSVICRIYYSPTSYVTWSMTAGKTSSTKEFMGVEVTANVDRDKGLIYFTAPSGDYAVPVMSKYKANNIRITATKTMEDDFSDIVSCSCCLMKDSKIILSGGNKPNQIYSANCEKPLYFPKCETAAIGQTSLPVTSLVSQSDKIIAFKKDSVYKVTLKKGKQLNTESLLADDDDIFYEPDSFTVDCISSHVGCGRKEAVTVFHEKAVWIGTDANIYALTSLSQIKRLSGKIYPFIKEMPDYSVREAVALNDGEYCYFFMYNTGLALKIDPYSLKEDNARWYIWEFPDELQIAGGISDDTSPVLMCLNNYSTCYFAVLGGEKDILLDRNTEEADERKINCRFVTSHYAPEGVNCKKRLDRIYLQLETKGDTVLKINDKMVKFENEVLKDSKKLNYTIFAGLKGFESFYISLESDEYLSFSQGKISYIPS